MIPQIIHYCWFGRGDYPELTKKCIDSWKKFLPNYKMILWNEENFDVNTVQYTKEAYAAKKYAFVADYVRLKALKQYGGIYFDTDVEVIKNMDELLMQKAFCGIEDTLLPGCGIIACEKENVIISQFLDFYNNKSFYNDIGQYDLTPNPCYFERILKRYGYQKNNKLQKIYNFMLYPDIFFNPPMINNEWKIYPETYTIHHYLGSWVNEKDIIQMEYDKKVTRYNKMFGRKRGEQIYRNIERIRQHGFKYWVGFVLMKIKKM